MYNNNKSEVDTCNDDLKDTWHAMLENNIIMCPLNLYDEIWQSCEACNGKATWSLQGNDNEIIICSHCLLKSCRDE